MNIERRSLAIDEVESAVPLLTVESRSEDDGNEREYVVGYAAKFGVLSLDLGDFVERIDPGAFGLVAERRGRRKPLETRALWNHDPNYPLARYPGTLRMTVDEVGLRYEFPVPDTSYGRDIASNIRAGIVKGSSFSFTVPSGGDSWAVEDGRSVRTIQSANRLAARCRAGDVSRVSGFRCQSGPAIVRSLPSGAEAARRGSSVPRQSCSTLPQRTEAAWHLVAIRARDAVTASSRWLQAFAAASTRLATCDARGAAALTSRS